MARKQIPFVPTVYEHGAFLIGREPEEVCASADLMVAALARSHELYHQSPVPVGMDIYNVEAEALGIPLRRAGKGELPALSGTLIEAEEDLEGLSLPDPQKAGRMPLMIEAASRLKQRLSAMVTGTIVGPFTLAAILRGFENFLWDMLEEPEFARKQLRFAQQVGLRYAAGFLENGIGVTINESWIAPPLCSPDLYRAFALPFEKKMLEKLGAMGWPGASIICGGNTSPILHDLLSTGTSFIMADWACDRPAYAAACQQKKVMLRASVEPSLLENENPDEIRQAVRTILKDCAGLDTLVIGCGIVPYSTAPEKVLAFEKIVREEQQ